MTEPVIAARAPIVVAVEAGKTYWWCACGKVQSSRSATDHTRARNSRR